VLHAASSSTGKAAGQACTDRAFGVLTSPCAGDCSRPGRGHGAEWLDRRVRPSQQEGPTVTPRSITAWMVRHRLPGEWQVLAGSSPMVDTCQVRSSTPRGRFVWASTSGSTVASCAQAPRERGTANAGSARRVLLARARRAGRPLVLWDGSLAGCGHERAPAGVGKGTSGLCPACGVSSAPISPESESVLPLVQSYCRFLGHPMPSDPRMGRAALLV